jgi:hypothetical protein
MRAVQCYDFESSHAVDKPAFSAIGFMPVLPGPCGLFRYHEVLRLLSRSGACSSQFVLCLSLRGVLCVLADQG